MRDTVGPDPCRITRYRQKKCSSIGSLPFAAARAPHLAVMTHANRAAVFHPSSKQAERLV
jgi:hypothetical protein